MSEKSNDDAGASKQEPSCSEANNAMSLQDAIITTNKAMSLCLMNKFSEAQQLLQPKFDQSIYHALGSSTICYLQAIMTYEPDAIQNAYKSVKKALEVCDRYRRSHTWTESLYNLVGKPHFHDYSEMEVHAELCYAECLLERAILTFIQDENLISFIKGGLKIKHAYNLYRSCLHIMSHCPNSMKSSDNRVDFEGGVHLGIGTFNLLLSLLPARILRLLEWVGFSGDKNLGLNHLNEGTKKEGIRSPLCAITMLGYRIVVGPILGISEPDSDNTKSVLNACLEKFPEGAIFLYYAGRLEQVKGRFEEAIEKYNLAVSVNVEWKQVHHVCFWELMWCHSFQGKWADAANYANLLFEESKWSKTTYRYFEGSFKLMEMFEKNGSLDWTSQDEEEQIMDIFRQVPEHKQRVAGKSLPFEKFAVYKAEKYLSKNRRLVLPGLEALYLWNGFSMCGFRKEILEQFLKLINTALSDVVSSKDSNCFYIDEYCLCKLLQGMCLRYLERSSESETCFQEVVASGEKLKLDKYLAPYAFAEIGYLYRSLGKYEDAIKQLESLRKRYSRYSLESRLHFRLHSNLQAMKEVNENGQTFSNDEDAFYDIAEDLCLQVDAQDAQQTASEEPDIGESMVGKETSV